MRRQPRNVTSRNYGSAVMYAPGKILYTGGGIPPVNSTEAINLNQASPSWRVMAPMAFARRHHNATLLADGKVLFQGSPEALVADPNVRRLYLGEGFSL